MKLNKKLIPTIISSVLAVACLVSGVFLTVNSTNTLIRKTKIVSEIDVPVSSGESDGADDEILEETDDSADNLYEETSSEDDFVSQKDEKDEINKKPTSENKPIADKENNGETDAEKDETETEKGTVYYVSASLGNDANSGTSQDKPLKTIGKVNTLKLNDGDKVLFKCGDLWRGEVLKAPKAYVTYSSYGEGEKPTFYGSYENYTGEEKWLPTKWENVWVLYKKIGDVGTFVLNDDKLVTRKETMTTPDKLDGDREHCINYNTNEVFFYSDKGNPGKVYSSIEAITSQRLINLQTGNTVENIKLKYANYGVQCWTGSDVTVRNMDISWIGGCGDEIRMGNAIEFWSNLDNIVIENNVISDCYDTGITCQYSGYDGESKDIVMSNIYVRNNKISDCFWSTEFWIHMKDDRAVGHFRNLQITDNVFENAGECWSYDQRPMPNATLFPYHLHLQAYTRYGDREIIIKNNILSGGSGGIIYGGLDNNYLPKMDSNTYIHKKGNFFGIIRGKSYSYDDSLSIILKTIVDKKAVVKYAE